MRGRRRRLELHRTAAGARAAYLRAATLVSDATGVPFDRLLAPARACRPLRGGQGEIAARRAAIYLAVTGLDVRAGALARALGWPRWRISDACRRVEDLRDRAEIDSFLERLEAML